jgi:hypothetical protein
VEVTSSTLTLSGFSKHLLPEGIGKTPMRSFTAAERTVLIPSAQIDKRFNPFFENADCMQETRRDYLLALVYSTLK